jgi:putative exporter of polyketide antibiotics
MTIVGSIETNQGQLHIQQNQQNSLKGLLWYLVASLLASVAFTLIIVTCAAILASLGILTGEYARETLAPSTFILVPVAIIVTYIAVKLAGYCFRNMIYHYGPKFQIVTKG